MKKLWKKGIIITLTILTISLLFIPVLSTSASANLTDNTILEKVKPEIEEEFEPESEPMLLVDGQIASVDSEGIYNLINEGDEKTITTTGELNTSLVLTGKWKLGNHIVLTGSVVITSGKFNTKDYDITAESLYVGLPNSWSSTVVKLGKSDIDVNTFAIRNSAVDFDAGTSTIVCTLLFDDFTKSGKKFNKVCIKSKNSIYGFIEGYSEFEELEIDGNSYITHNLKVNQEYKVNSGEVKAGKTAKKPINMITITAPNEPLIVYED